MKFRNIKSGIIEEPVNKMVIEQYEKHPEIWEKVKDSNNEYAELKAKATEMGIEFKSNIKKADLEKLIAEKEQGNA